MRSRRRTYCVVLAVLLGGLVLVGSASASATFTKAFGWGVNGNPTFESCTGSCQAGLPGTGNGQFDDPAGVAVDGSGNIFVADNINSRIEEFDNTDAFIRSFGTAQLSSPNHVAVDSSGNVYVADINNDVIDKYSNTGTFLTSIGAAGAGAGQLSAPHGVAVDGSGNVFVGDFGNNRIDEFSNTGSFVMAWGWGVQHTGDQFETCTTVTTCQAGSAGGGAGQLDEPDGVAVNSSGVYVADFANNRIDQFSSSGSFMRAWGWGVENGASGLETCFSTCQTGAGGSGFGQLNAPEGVTLDSSGNVYVGDSANNRIDEYSPVGVFFQSFGTAGTGSGQFEAPNGVAINSLGLYVADLSNQRIDQWAVSTPSGGGGGGGGSGGGGSGGSGSASGHYATTTSLYSNLNPSAPGDQVTFTASVSPDPASGTVAFTLFGQTISGCQAVPVTLADKASCTVMFPAARTWPVVASFSGGTSGAATYAASQSPTLNQVVTSSTSLKGTKTRVFSSRNPAGTGKQVTFTAEIAPTPDGGSVKFLNNGSVISGCRSVSVSGGEAKCRTRFHARGLHEIQAVYSGDNNFVGSQSLAAGVSVVTHHHRRHHR